jgi:hypothetical protein
MIQICQALIGLMLLSGVLMLASMVVGVCSTMKGGLSLVSRGAGVVIIYSSVVFLVSFALGSILAMGAFGFELLARAFGGAA